MFLPNHFLAGFCKHAIKHLEAAKPSLGDEIIDMKVTQTDDMVAIGERDKWTVKVKIPSQVVDFRERHMGKVQHTYCGLPR